MPPQRARLGSLQHVPQLAEGRKELAATHPQVQLRCVPPWGISVASKWVGSSPRGTKADCWALLLFWEEGYFGCHPRDAC